MSRITTVFIVDQQKVRMETTAVVSVTFDESYLREMVSTICIANT